MSAVTTFEGEVKTHRFLWRAAYALKPHCQPGQDGNELHRMTAMLLACATVEGYANFLLDVLDRAAFDNERNLFRSDTLAKFKHLAAKLGVDWNPGAREVQTIRGLFKFRDSMMHAKPEVYGDVVEHSVDEEPPPMRASDWAERSTLDKYQAAVADVEAFCEQFHASVLAVEALTDEQRQRLEPSALSGSMQMQQFATTLRR